MPSMRLVVGINLRTSSKRYHKISSWIGQKMRFPPTLHACYFSWVSLTLKNGPRINLIIIFDDTPLSNDNFAFQRDFICGLRLEHFGVRKDGLNIKLETYVCCVIHSSVWIVAQRQLTSLSSIYSSLLQFIFLSRQLQLTPMQLG